MSNHIKVETTFNVERFENLLADHPNQPFVHSVMTGLREGFRPLKTTGYGTAAPPRPKWHRHPPYL
jgi:hypothetical protein